MGDTGAEHEDLGGTLEGTLGGTWGDIGDMGGTWEGQREWEV